MKIHLTNDGIIVVPETDFESEYLRRNFKRQDIKCFQKCGLTASEFIGLKIISEKEDDNE